MEALANTLNGFSLEGITHVVEAIKENPEIAKFELRATNKWFTGGHNRSTIQGFYGACQEDTSREEPFVYDNDEPPILLGTNKGANPAEVILHGLLGCMTTSMVLLASAHGIEIKDITSRVEGDFDLQGFLGLDPSIEKGSQQIRVSFDIEGVSEEQKKELLELSKQSPVYNTILNPTDVKVTVQ